MHYTEYNQVCSKCGSPIEYKELGRSIIITPCPCQTTKLTKTCQWVLDNMTLGKVASKGVNRVKSYVVTPEVRTTLKHFLALQQK